MESGAKQKRARQPADGLLENPLRARLAAELEAQSLSPSELAAAVDEPLALVAYHCRVLELAGGFERPPVPG
jgi:hypothetical protein